VPVDAVISQLSYRTGNKYHLPKQYAYAYILIRTPIHYNRDYIPDRFSEVIPVPVDAVISLEAIETESLTIYQGNMPMLTS
jgi:hypothetical protein